MKHPVLFLFCALGTTVFAAPDFTRDIEPIFEARCLDCHGPDKQKSELRVDQRVLLLKGGDSGLPAIVPGKPEKSYLVELIKHPDQNERMPPGKKKPLSSAEIALIEAWIADGAQWPGQMDAKLERKTDLWSMQPVKRPEVPKITKARSPVDAFLLQKLGAKQLAYNPPADARSLIRRTAILLTGLPPTPERVAAFDQAFATDAKAAHHELVEELLASPHFGERWAQHWLDVIRWAETNGSEANLYRKNAWVYRDYVVRAFNDDVPYDQFVREQLAGDSLGMGEATGFLVAGPHVPAATVGQEETAIRQARADRMDEIMQTVGASMLGMTVSCARCHNHKFDPISIQDYYALTAVFQGIEFGGRYPEYAPDHPVRKRAEELHQEQWKNRAALRKGSGVWEEDWGAFKELHFPPRTLKKLRLVMVGGWGRLDEVQLFWPTTKGKSENFALASAGTTTREGDNASNPRAPLKNVNDGLFGTNGWSAKGIKGNKQKPWIEFTFSEPREIGRMRLSTNREYYYDTDYLDKKPKLNFGDYRIDVQDEAGNWKPLAGSGMARSYLERDPKRRQAHAHQQALIARFQEEGPRTSFIGQVIKPVTTYVLHRGSPENRRDVVDPAGFAILEGELNMNQQTNGRERRKRFADWLTRPEHPLTARVMVNRIWHHLFGTGIVSTTADFGEAGAPPSHPEMLDWLTHAWMHPQGEATPWSVKDLIRSLVSTEAFRQSSLPREDGLAADAGARLLWRFPPRRMEAEVLRDGMLQATGKLAPRIGGRSFRIHNVKKTYAQWQVVKNHGPDTWRRMLYQERMRRVDDRMFTAFDFPDCGQVRAKRPVSTTPLQALNLMNSPFVVEQAELLAKRVKREAVDELDAQVRRCFQLLFNRDPNQDELRSCLEVAQQAGLAIICRSLFNANEFAFIP